MPRPIHTDPDATRLLAYLFDKADETGLCRVTSGEIMTILGVSRQRVRTLIDLIVSTNKATKSATKSATNIRFDFKAVNPQSATNLPTKSATKQSTKKARSAFRPPTENEVADYCSEKGYHFNPEQFVPFYESKGWKVGDQPMKSWKAACKTWEAKWKEKHGEQFYYQIQRPQPPLRGQQRNGGIAGVAAAILQRTAGRDPHKPPF